MKAEHWIKIFEREYQATNPKDFLGNTKVWRSYVTGTDFSPVEIKEWVLNFKSKLGWLIKDGCSVLDVGCGNGLSLELFSSHFGSYTGIDLAPTAINNLRTYFSYNPLIEFKTLDARMIYELRKKYDIIILNSVAQYFPNKDYFADFIQQALILLNDKGVLFIGDLRSSLHTWLVERTEEQNQNSIKFWRPESELLINPMFFESLLTKADFEDYRIDLKRGFITNELSRYRYDVFIFKNKPSTLSQPTVKSVVARNHRYLKLDRNDPDNISPFYLEQPFDGTFFIDFAIERGVFHIEIKKIDPSTDVLK